MRRRMLNPDFFTDPDIVAKFDAFGRLFYQGLWCVADDSGCLELNPLFLKMKIFPGDNISLEKIQEYIDLLIKLKKIITYEIDSKNYGWLKNFHKHQKLSKPSAPVVPLPSWIIWHGEDELGNKRHKYFYEIDKDFFVQDKSKTEKDQKKDDTCPEEKLKEVKRSKYNNNRHDSDSKPDSSHDIESPNREDGSVIISEKQEDNQSRITNKSDSYKTCCLLIDCIIDNNPRARVPNKDPTDSLMQKWCKELDKLHHLGPVGAKKDENKGYSWSEIAKIINWCQNDIFWKSNILSAGKLREKIITLENQMRNSSNTNNYNRDKIIQKNSPDKLAEEYYQKGYR